MAARITSTIETERKYDAVEPLPELAGTDTVTEVRRQPLLTLTAVYYDTDDGRLAADGLTLRRRSGGPDEGWHLKLPHARHSREEIRAPLAEQPPGELLALVRSRIRRRPLHPVVLMRTERQPWHLLDADGATVAEVVLDRVTAERAGRTAQWSEIEVELAPGTDPALLDALHARLRAAGAHPLDTPSKLARALAETSPAPGGAPASRLSPGAAAPAAGTAAADVLAYAREQVRALVVLDPAVRRDLPDAVHRMRVASRRLRSCLRSYKRVLAREATRPLGDELRWLAGELGRDRDGEVLARRLHDGLRSLPPELRRGPVAQRLRSYLDADRDAARASLTRTLDSPRYLNLLDELESFLAAPPLRPKATRPARRVAAAAIRREQRRLAARLATALETPPGPDRDAALHEARKAAKAARYAAEAARPSLGRPARKRASRLSDLQSALGDLQDSVLARAALRRIADQAGEAGEPTFSYGALHEREAARAAARQRDLPGVSHACPGLGPKVDKARRKARKRARKQAR